MSYIDPEFLDPHDNGERFVPDFLAGTLWNDTHYRWGILDRNTFVLMRKRTGRNNESQPDMRGKFIWRGDEAQARWWCDRLNAETRPRHIDPGTGPDMQAKRLDVGVLIGQARRQRTVAVPPPVFVRCDACKTCHKSGACPS
jgi:hypothetical protein